MGLRFTEGKEVVEGTEKHKAALVVYSMSWQWAYSTVLYTKQSQEKMQQKVKKREN